MKSGLMIEAGELDIAIDELRWLLADCPEFIAAHALLGELALRQANDLPLARGHFGAGYQLGLQALRRAKMPKPLLYSQPANRPFFEAGRGLAVVPWRSSARLTWRMKSSTTLVELDPSDPLKLRAMLDDLQTGGKPIVDCCRLMTNGSSQRDPRIVRQHWWISWNSTHPTCGQRAKTPLGNLRPSAVFKNNSPAAGGWPQLPKMPSAQICRELGRPDARRVARYEHERAVFGRQLAAHRQQRQQVVADLPRLALAGRGRSWAGRESRRRNGCRASARGGRISPRLRRSSGSADRRGRRARRSAARGRRCFGPRRCARLRRRPPRPPACCRPCTRTN